MGKYIYARAFICIVNRRVVLLYLGFWVSGRLMVKLGESVVMSCQGGGLGGFMPGVRRSNHLHTMSGRLFSLSTSDLSSHRLKML